MKKIRKMLVKFLAITMMTCSLVSADVSAASATMTASTNASASAIFNEICLTDTMGNEYCRGVWSSLNDAKDYFGHDFKYSSCYRYFDGRVYNYNYNFAEGTKCYFVVAE